MTTLGAFNAKNGMLSGSFWQLVGRVNGYERPFGNALVTQVEAGRSFQVIDDQALDELEEKNCKRKKVCLLEDGYTCWIELSEINGKCFPRGLFKPELLNYSEIKKRMPAVLAWVEKASNEKNKYLWGGTFGPDFDCSGLVQAAFASQGIWLPRDAYQQESFCEAISISSEDYSLLKPGDLLFFGDKDSCDHVGIYRGKGFYWHSSGIRYGRNGIGCDGLDVTDKSQVACYYRSKLRGAGRVRRCHDGTTLP